MGYLKNIFGKGEPGAAGRPSDPQPQQLSGKRAAQPDWQTNSVLLELLARFYRGADPWTFIGKEHWEDVLGEKVEHAIESLRLEGALVKASTALTLSQRYSVSDFHYLLSERKLSTEGNSDTLLQRLIEADPEGAGKLAMEINVLILSDGARACVTHYVRSERERRRGAERQCLIALGQKDYLRAALVVGEYQQDSVFSRGVGVAVGDDDHTANVFILQGIFERVPAMLKHLDIATLDALRPAAGMAFLWGKDNAEQWINTGLQIDGPHDAEIICAMLRTHARYLSDLARYQSSNHTIFEIWSENDGATCASCRGLTGQPHRLESLPELPHEHCSSTQGCRCTVVVSGNAF